MKFGRSLVNEEGLSSKGLFGGLLKELRETESSLPHRLTQILPLGVIEKVCDLEDWERSGTNTYFATGKVLISEDGWTTVFAKAFVAPTLDPVRQQEIWEARRGALSEKGILTPIVYATLPAMTIEQFIPREIVSLAEFSLRQIFEIGRISKAVSDIGFSFVTIFEKLRLLGDEIYCVNYDFPISNTVAEEEFLKCLGAREKAIFLEALHGSSRALD